MIADFFRALGQYSKAIRFMSKHRLWWVMLFPTVLTLIIFFTGSYATGDVSDVATKWVNEVLGMNDWDFWSSGVWVTVIEYLIWISFTVLWILIFGYVVGSVLLVVMAPLFAWLSEKTDELETGKTYPFSVKQLMKDMVRGVRVALRNFVRQTLMILGFTILAMIIPIPFLGPAISGVAILMINSYFYGFSFMDYSNERLKRDAIESIQYIRKNKGTAIGNGVVFYTVVSIPVIGPLAGSFFAVLGVVAGTLAMIELDKRDQNRQLN